MARTSSKAKKTKQEVMKSKTENNEQVSESEHKGSNTSDTENEEGNYEVEQILHTRMFRGKRQYLIRWKGYDEGSDTWEHESAVESCPEALADFKKKSSTIDEADLENEQNMKENKPIKKQSKMSLKEENANDLKRKSNKTNSKVNKKKKVSSSDSENENSTVSEPDSENEESSKDKISKIQTNSRANKKMKVSASERENDPSTFNESDPVNGESYKEKKSKKEDLKRKGNKASGKNKQNVTAPGDKNEDGPLTDGNDYEVEKILEVHTRRDGTKEFLVRWKGYTSKDDTWEPEAHLDCKELIEKIMAKVEKGKNMPVKELRESVPEKKKFIPAVRAGGRQHNLRTMGVRPFYQE